MFTEVRRAFSREYYQSILCITEAALARQYRDSFLGCLWSLLKPLAHIAVLTLIFSNIVAKDQSNYVLYLLCGIIPWTYVNCSIIESTYSLLNRSESLKRCLISRTIFPIADNLKHAYIMLISMSLVIVVSVLHYGFFWQLIALPLAILPLIISTIAFCIMISFLTPYIRDMTELMNILLSLLLYSTPIIYKQDILPEKIQKILMFNPAYWLLMPIKDILYYKRFTEVTDIAIISLVTVTFVSISLLVYKKLRRNVIFYL